jgi:hypothetical protein
MSPIVVCMSHVVLVGPLVVVGEDDLAFGRQSRPVRYRSHIC